MLKERILLYKIFSGKQKQINFSISSLSTSSTHILFSIYKKTRIERWEGEQPLLTDLVASSDLREEDYLYCCVFLKLREKTCSDIAARVFEFLR